MKWQARYFPGQSLFEAESLFVFACDFVLGADWEVNSRSGSSFWAEKLKLEGTEPIRVARNLKVYKTVDITKVAKQ